MFLTKSCLTIKVEGKKNKGQKVKGKNPDIQLYPEKKIENQADFIIVPKVVVKIGKVAQGRRHLLFRDFEAVLISI